jgi:transposase
MAFQQKDIARTLRPYTLHAQQLMAQARADVERLPAVLAQVQRALEHAGLADTFRLLQKRRGGRCHCAGLDDGGLGWLFPGAKDERRRGPFGKSADRQRPVVERLVARLKQFRRVATRHGGGGAQAGRCPWDHPIVAAATARAARSGVTR